MCKKCAQERDLQIRSEVGKEQENFVAYVEDYFQLIPSDGQKKIRELHQHSKKKIHTVKQFLINICSECLSPMAEMILLSPLSSGEIGKNKTNASVTIISLFIFLSKPNIILVTPAMKRPYGIVSTSDGPS